MDYGRRGSNPPQERAPRLGLGVETVSIQHRTVRKSKRFDPVPRQSDCGAGLLMLLAGITSGWSLALIGNASA
jgi:hypothetical protein